MVHRRLRGLAAILGALGIALAHLPLAFADGTCSMACDPACSACCPQWQIRASCGSDSHADGAFTTYAAAAQAAAQANTTATACDPHDAACAAVHLACAGAPGGAAPWQVACASETLSPDAFELVTRELDAGASALADSSARADKELDSLLAFGRDRILTTKGQKAVGGVAVQLRAATALVTAARVDGDLVRVRGAAAPKVQAWQNQQAAAAKAVDDAIASAEAFVHDPTVIDAAAEERARKAREAEAARADAQQRAELAKQQAEEARQAAETARLQAEAARRAAADQTERDRQGAVEKRVVATSQSITDQRTKIGTALASVAALLAKPGLSPHTRDAALGVQRQLAREDDALHAVEGRAALSHGLPSAVGSGRASELEGADVAFGKQTAAGLAAAAALLATAGAEASAPPARVATPPSIPTCVISFAAATPASVTLSVDGAKAVPLPADVKLASGRHALVTRAGNATAKTSELLICNRISKLVLEVPK